MSKPPDIELPPLTGPSREECDYTLGVYMRVWGAVETAVSQLIQKFLDTDPISAQIVIRTVGSMHAQREMASELGLHRLAKASDRQTLKKLMRRLKSANTKRNRIVHGAWQLVIVMGEKTRATPLRAKSQEWIRSYTPSEDAVFQELMQGKNKKLNAAYKFPPDSIISHAKSSQSLAEDIISFANAAQLRPPRIPQHVEW